MMSIEEFRPHPRGTLSILSFMMQYPSVKAWLEGIRHGRATKTTKTTYAKGLLEYCRLTKRTPDQLLAERENEYLAQDKTTRFKAEDAFRNVLSTYTGKTSVAFVISASAKSFYRFHRIPLNEAGLAYHSDTNKDYLPSQEEILRIYLQVSNRASTSNLRDAALVLFLAQTGLRPQTVVKLRYRNIQCEFESRKIPMAVSVPSRCLQQVVRLPHSLSADSPCQDCQVRPIGRIRTPLQRGNIQMTVSQNEYLMWTSRCLQSSQYS